MSYRIEFGGRALIQLNGLPPDAFDALVERVLALADEPWDAVVMTPGMILRCVRRRSARATDSCRSGWMNRLV